MVRIRRRNEEYASTNEVSSLASSRTCVGERGRKSTLIRVSPFVPTLFGSSVFAWLEMLFCIFRHYILLLYIRFQSCAMLPSDSAVFGLARHKSIILSYPVRFSVICESPDKSISLSLLVSIKDGGDKSSCTLVESASHLISGMVHWSSSTPSSFYFH